MPTTGSFQGTFKINGGGGGDALPLILLAVGDITVIGIAAVAGIAFGGLVTWLIVRTRRQAPSARPGLRYLANPNASPLPQRKPQTAIAPPVVINNFTIDPAQFAAFIAAQQPQPAQVIVQPEQEELPR
jgi:hypothetical protein